MSDTIIAAVIGAVAVIIPAIIRWPTSNKDNSNYEPTADEKEEPPQMAVSQDKGAAINVSGSHSSITLNSNTYYSESSNSWKKERGLLSLCHQPSYWMHAWTTNDYYDFGMERHRYLEFIPLENPLIFCFSETIIDGELVSVSDYDDNDLSLSLKGKETSVKVYLPLKTNNLVSKSFKCEIVFYLKTFSDHPYKEIVKMTFRRDDGFWHLEEYNTSYS